MELAGRAGRGDANPWQGKRCSGHHSIILWLLGAIVLLQATGVHSACCTPGQPTYVGSQFTQGSYNGKSVALTFGTCSDGPCSGTANNVAFDYLQLQGTTQSQYANSCCDVSQLDSNGADPNGFYYNPRQGTPVSPTTSWAGDLGALFNNGNYIPGTGYKTCDASLPVVRCAINDISTTTCQSSNYSTDPTACGPDKIYNSSQGGQSPVSADVCCRDLTCKDSNYTTTGCPTGYKYSTANDNAKPPCVEKCCVALTCQDRSATSSCDAGYKYNSAKDSTSLINAADYNTVCCQVKTCSDLAAEESSCPSPLSYNATKSANTPVTNSFASDCCEQPPKTPTCSELASSAATCAAGVYNASKSANTPVTTNFTADCCEQPPKTPTCSELASSAATCAAGVYNASKSANTPVTTSFTADCCEQPPKTPTCCDSNGDGKNDDPWPCPANDGYVTNPSTASQPNPSTATCCLRRFCADVDPLTPGPQKYSCSQLGLVYDNTADSKSPPSDATCCKPGSPPEVPSPSPLPTDSPSPSPVPTESPSPSPTPSPSPEPGFVPTCGKYTPDGKSWIEAGGSCPPPSVYIPAESANLSNQTAPNVGASWSAICCTITPQSTPNVNIKKSVSSAKFKGDDTGTYTLVITSDSLDTAATGVKVNDTIPDGLTPITNSVKVVNKNNQPTSDTCTFSGRVLKCDLGDMSANSADPTQTKTITFQFTVLSVVAPTFIDNTAWVYCSNKVPGSQATEPNCLGKNSTVPIQVVPDTPTPPQNTVSLTVTASKACVDQDMDVNVVADPGLSPVKGVIITATCTKAVDISKVTSPANGCKLVRGTVHCVFSKLTKPQTITFTVSGSKAGSYKCTARAKIKGNNKDITRDSGSGTVLDSGSQQCAPPAVNGGCCINPGTAQRQCLAKVSAATCKAKGGSWKQSQTCSTTWCPEVPPPASGSCCRWPNTTFAACSTSTQAECTGSTSKWVAGTGQCSATFCPKLPPPPVTCQCMSCGSPGSQWPSKCCDGFYCGCSGNRWSGYREVCLPVTTSSRSSRITPAAAGMCSTAGRDCSMATGKQCCEGANLDCVLQGDGGAKCVSRRTCGAVGSTCQGLGDCCGGLVCGSNNKCKVAACQATNSCKPTDAACNAQRSLECEVVYAAAMGSPINGTSS